MKEFETIILGGGASGCMCMLSSKQESVAIIDKESKIAKKLLVTGNGRCNISNLNVNSNFYNINIDKYLKKFKSPQTLKFFEGLGLICYADEEGRLYPISNTAKSVVNVIENAVQKKNVSTYLDNNVLDVKRDNDKFIIITDKDKFLCKKLVVATGKSDILDKLGVKYKQFTPSLCSLKTNSTHSLNNVRIRNVKVTGVCDGKEKSDVGEILFKEAGISGIALFNISTLFARAGKYEGKIYLDLMPKISSDELESYLLKRRDIDLAVPNFFDGMFAREVAYEILNQAKVDENKTSTKLTKEEIKKFIKIIKNLEFTVKGYFPNNQVYSGGVSLDDLDDNLQHKVIKNLYFCGEICNIDGECGGYNLQWAWTSGHIVGKNI